MDAGNCPHEFLVLGLEKNTPLPVKVAEHKLLISLCIVEQVEIVFKQQLGPKNLWDKLCANTKAQSAWLRIMLQEGIVTAGDILDQSNTGLLSLYRKTVATQNAAIAVRVLEHWFTGCPSGAQGLDTPATQGPGAGRGRGWQRR